MRTQYRQDPGNRRRPRRFQRWARRRQQRRRGREHRRARRLCGDHAVDHQRGQAERRAHRRRGHGRSRLWHHTRAGQCRRGYGNPPDNGCHADCANALPAIHRSRCLMRGSTARSYRRRTPPRCTDPRFRGTPPRLRCRRGAAVSGVTGIPSATAAATAPGRLRGTTTRRRRDSRTCLRSACRVRVRSGIGGGRA